MATTTREPELTPVKFSRLTRRGVLLGLSGPQLVMASLASGTLIVGLYVGAVVMTFPIILFLVALAFVGVGGRKLIEWAPIGARWLWRSTGGQLLYRRRIVYWPRSASPFVHGQCTASARRQRTRPRPDRRPKCATPRHSDALARSDAFRAWIRDRTPRSGTRPWST